MIEGPVLLNDWHPEIAAGQARIGPDGGSWTFPSARRNPAAGATVRINLD